MENEQLKSLAGQLRKPTGMAGIETGAMMNKANEQLYQFTLKQIGLRDGDQVLEIGFGNGYFFQQIFATAKDLQLWGLDYAPDMVAAATQLNKDLIDAGKLQLFSGDAKSIPLPDRSVDHIFCINVIYFWDDPVAVVKEIARVLKPGGTFTASIRTKSTMLNMPFTQYGFTMYEIDEWEHLLRNNHFLSTHSAILEEIMVAPAGQSYPAASACITGVMA